MPPDIRSVLHRAAGDVRPADGMDDILRRSRRVKRMRGVLSGLLSISLIALGWGVWASIDSPDERSLLPADNDDGLELVVAHSNTLQVVGPDEIWGTRIDPLEHDDTESNPRWAADGQRVLYSRLSGGDANFGIELHMTDKEGRDDAQLTSTPQAHEVESAWAPNGRHVALVRTFPQGSEIIGTRGDVYVLDPATGEETRITRNSPLEGSLSWSPRGDAISYVRGAKIFIALQEDDWRSQQVVLEREVFEAAWSPSGDQIAFTSQTKGGRLPDSDVFILDVDSGDIQRATKGRQASRVRWSSDGNWITFVEPEDPALPRAFFIRLVSSGGGDVRELGGPFPDFDGYDLRGTPDDS